MRDLLPETERASVSIRLRQQLTEKIDLSATLLSSTRESTQYSTAYSFDNTRPTFVGPPTFFAPPTPVPVEGNPIQPESLVRFNGARDNIDSAFARSTNDSKNYSLNIGLDAELWGSWTGKVNFIWNQNQIDNDSRFQIPQATIPEGLDILAAGLQSPEFYETVFNGGGLVGNETVLKTLNFSLSGDVVELPAGNAKLSFGAEVREEDGDVGDGANTYQRDVNSVFGELYVPVFGGDHTLPGLQNLGFTVAGRYESYDESAVFGTFQTADFSAFAPSAGFVWSPVDSVEVRGNWSESFTVPQLLEQLQPTVTFPSRPFFDPLAGPDGMGEQVPVFSEFGALPDVELVEQTGDTYTLSVEWSPASVDGLTLSATYNKVQYDNFIGTIRTAISGSTEDFLLLGNERVPGSVLREPGQTTIRFGSINFAERISRSVDYSAIYEFDTDLGLFNAQVRATQAIEDELIFADGEARGNQAGTLSGPADWVIRSSLYWSRDNWSATATVNHQSAVENTSFRALRADVGSYNTVDTQVTYDTNEWLDGGRITLGVNDLFNEDFPFVDGPLGFDGRQVDFRKRRIYLEFRKTF